MTTSDGQGPDEAQWDEIADWLRRRDPAGAVPAGIGGRRRERLVWLMQRPLLAFLALHHRATAACGAALAVALVLAVLFAVRAREERLLPPVAVAFEDPSAAPVAPEPDLPEEPSVLLP